MIQLHEQHIEDSYIGQQTDSHQPDVEEAAMRSWIDVVIWVSNLGVGIIRNRWHCRWRDHTCTGVLPQKINLEPQ